MGHRRWLLTLAVCALALGCHRDAKNQARDAGVPSAAPSAKAPQRPSPFAAASAEAFDLALIEDGAVLVRSSAKSPGIWLYTLDARGRPQGEEKRLITPQGDKNVREIFASGAGARVAVAWIESDQAEARARGLLYDAKAGREFATFDLGPVDPPLAAPRGNLAIANRDGEFLLLFRGRNASCADRREQGCVEFGFRNLRASGAETWGLPLSVPEPCASHAVSFAVAVDRWHYGVCSRRSGKPVTTVFSIQYEPEYARAEPVLEGCSGLGAAELDGELAVVGDCSGQRHGLRFGRADQRPREIRLDRVEARCSAKRLVLETKGAGGFELELKRPREHLEALLPRELAPAGARAVWTGRALLVAKSQNGELARFACYEDKLRELGQ